MSTTARPPRNNEKRTVDAILESDAQFLQGLKVFTSDSDSVAGLAGGNAQNSPSTPAGNYLAREGDSMIGPFALGPPLDFRIEVDANNTIDIGIVNENPQYTSNIQLDDFQPNSSVLDIIAGAAFDGQILVIRTFAPTVPYTISQGTIGNGGNIQTPDGNDFTVGDLQTFELIFDESLIINANTGGTWRVKSAVGGGGATTQSTWRIPARVGLIGFNFFFPNIQEVEDGVTLVPGDRVLQTAELNPINNGLWEVQAPLIPGIPNLYLLARPTDFLPGAQGLSESFVAIEEGTLNAKKVFHLTDANPIVIDTDAQTWEPFGGGGIIDPIILNENDLGTIGFITQLINWDEANFFRTVINGNVSFSMQNLPATGKWEQIVLEITQDVVGGHSVTFLDTFANAVIPQVNPGANSKTVIAFYAYNDGSDVILAFDTQSNFNAYPENDLGTLGPAAVNIDWSLGNFQRMVLSGDVTITHTSLPAPLQWQQVIIEYTQDITGNHNVTYTQSFGNGVVPLVNFTPTSKTTVVFYAYNTGTITIILAFETLSSGNTNFIHATKVANQAPPLTVATPATFDSILSNSGLTVAAGIVSGFRKGRIYECECSIAILNAVNAAACLSFQWNDIANATLIGTHGDAILATQLAGDSGQPIAKAIFAPLADTDTLEVQFTFNNDLVNTFMYGAGIPGTPSSYIMIKDIT